MILLSWEIASTCRQRRAPQVTIFMGTLNQFITLALWDSGMTWLLRYEMTGKYMPIATSKIRNEPNEITVSITEACGPAVKQQIPILMLIKSKQYLSTSSG